MLCFLSSLTWDSISALPLGCAPSHAWDPQKKHRYDNGVYDDGSGQMDAEEMDISSFFGVRDDKEGGEDAVQHQRRVQSWK